MLNSGVERVLKLFESLEYSDANSTPNLKVWRPRDHVTSSPALNVPNGRLCASLSPSRPHPSAVKVGRLKSRPRPNISVGPSGSSKFSPVHPNCALARTPLTRASFKMLAPNVDVKCTDALCVNPVNDTPPIPFGRISEPPPSSNPLLAM